MPLVVSDSDSKGSAPGHIEAPARMALNCLPKEKRPRCKKQLKAHRDLSDGSDEDMGDSEGGAAMSDGESALRSTQVHEQGKKRGPENHTLNHWNEPKATIGNKTKLRWLFKCRYCDQ